MDNPDPTARAVRAFCGVAGIDRAGLLIWNVIPWWNGRIATRAAELRDGAARLDDLLPLLPDLRAVICVGRKAETATGRLSSTGFAVFSTAHPSAQVRAAYPDRWSAIPGVWAQAWAAARIA